MASKSQKETATLNHKILTAVGIALCVILVPILLVNVVLIIRSYTNSDEVPTIGGYCPLIVLSDSMEPDIMTGDLIICKQINKEDVKVDDVIAFFDPDSNNDSILTHRVKEVIVEADGSIYFRTKGDHNNAEDPSRASAEKLVGIYTGTRIPGAGNVAMFMSTTAGLVICVVLPLILLVAYDVIRRKRHDSKTQEDTAALLAELEALKAAKAAEQSGAEVPASTEAEQPDDDPAVTPEK